MKKEKQNGANDNADMPAMKHESREVRHRSICSCGCGCGCRKKLLFLIMILNVILISLVLLSGCTSGGFTGMSGKISEYDEQQNENAAGVTDTASEYIVAGPEYLAEIDAKADALRQKILGSVTVVEAESTPYYVSNSGDDANNGKSPDEAWATLEKVNSAPLAEGDAVFFERGGLWRGQLKTKSGVTYSAYGNGDKPKLFGSSQAAVSARWSATAVENVYEYAVSFPFSNEPGNIIFNDGETCGIKKFLGEKDYWGGRYPGVEDFNGVNDLDEDLEFYHDIASGKLYIYSEDGNPAERYSSIEIAHKPHTIRNGGNDVTIDNLCIKYTGSHGISSGTCKGLTVTNCEFGWIGGSIQSEANPYFRFGNAVEIYGGCDGYTVENCYIYQVYDAGVTHQRTTPHDSTMKNVRYIGNLFEHCIYSIEYFLGHPADSSPVLLMSDIIFRGNICRFAGYGWGDQRPNKTEAAHIKSWNSQNPAERFIIENNIFDRSKYMMLHIAASKAESLPVMKGNTYIQDIGAQFGKFGAGAPAMRMFDETVGEFIKNTVADADAEVRYITG
ncbi:MAG: hypothetical protein PHG48_02510 [Eubacteriales bacterium]|nr:hypothetical protein [Eubacteriales bacterium]